MAHYRLVISESSSEEDFPLQHLDLEMNVHLDFGGIDVPDPARRRIAVHALKRIIDAIDGDDLEQDGAGRRIPRRPSTRPPARQVEYESGDDWIRPAGIDMRVIKSAHRVVQEIAKRGVNGRAVLASELVQDGLVSAPTMSRLLRDDEVAGQYLSPYLVVSASGRTKALDLTAKGRLLASKIRAGVVPS